MAVPSFTYAVYPTMTTTFQSEVVGSKGISDSYNKKFVAGNTNTIVLPFEGSNQVKKINIIVMTKNNVTDIDLGGSISVKLNSYSKYEGIVLNLKEMYNDSVEKLNEEELSMYKSIYNGILLIEKAGIFLGILFSVFVLALPFYTSINWLLSVGAALPGAAISIFLYNLVRGDRE